MATERKRKSKDDLNLIINTCKFDKKDNKKISYARVTRSLLAQGLKLDDSTVSRYFRAYENILKGEPIPDSFIRFLNLDLLEELCSDQGLTNNFRKSVANVPGLCELETNNEPHQEEMDFSTNDEHKSEGIPFCKDLNMWHTDAYGILTDPENETTISHGKICITMPITSFERFLRGVSRNV